MSLTPESARQSFELQPKLRSKRCRECLTYFQPRNSLQVVCSPDCARVYAKRVAARKERKERDAERRELKAAKAKLKTRSELTREAQRAFNAWIRWRDRFDGCISCRKPATYPGQWHASHYRSTAAAPELRFDESNVHKSCAQCNSMRSGNIVEYRIKLVRKIGIAGVERLEGPHEPKRYTEDELRDICREYRARLREAKRV